MNAQSALRAQFTFPYKCTLVRSNLTTNGILSLHCSDKNVNNNNNDNNSQTAPPNAVHS